MGLIERIFGAAEATQALGDTVKGVAEVFVPNRTEEQRLAQAAYIAALQEAGAEFAIARGGWFDVFINGINRLPRPMLAFGTIGLFVYAMVDPPSFGQRMVGLQAVPEPLWWLLAAIVGFYFGAREAHYFRLGKGVTGSAKGPASAKGAAPSSSPLSPPVAALPQEPNAALADWRADR